VRKTRSILAEHAVLFRPLVATSRGFYGVVACLLAVIGLGVHAYITQFDQGLGVTGMNRPVYWGFYITNFVFFIGISHAGTLISAILRVTGAEWRRPITRAAEAITCFALCLGVPQVLMDLGRPDRMFNVPLHGRIMSPILWDLCCISVYLSASVTYLYLPLIPDLALCRDHPGISRWRRRLYGFFALGWQGTEKQRHRLEKLIGVMAIAIIPIAISVHTVVSFIFAMTVQPMWHAAILGPYFVVGAIFSGIASIIIAMVILRKVLHLEAYLLPSHFKNLGLLLLTMCLLWMYFTGSEFLTTFYGNEPAHMAVFDAKFHGAYAPAFWVMVLLCFVIPFPILAFKKTRTITGCVIASIAINIGMWMERFTIVVPSLSLPRLPYDSAIYLPTWVEWSTTAASFATLALLYVLFLKIFPIISVWEVEEGREEEEPESATKQPAEAEVLPDVGAPSSEWRLSWPRTRSAIRSK
jgi:molybdopterin-containing oxidoreductase family membrane subunit